MRYFKIAIRFLLRQKRNFIISMLGMVLGIILLLTTCNILYSNEMRNYNEASCNIGRYQYRLTNLPEEKVNILKRHAKVKSCYSVKNLGYIEHNYRKIMVDYIEENALRNVFSFDILKGRYSTNSDEIVISSKLLRSIMKDKDIGDKVHLKISTSKGAVEREFIIVGIIDDKEYRKEDIDVNGIILTQDLWSNSNYDCYINIFEEDELRSICRNIEVKYSKSTVGGSGLGMTVFPHPYYNGVKLFDPRKDKGALILVFMVLISYIFIANSFKVTIKERTEIILLARTVGMSPGQVCISFFIEALVLCLLSLSLGVSLSYIVSGFQIYKQALFICVPVIIICILYSAIAFVVSVAYSKPAKLFRKRYNTDEIKLEKLLNRRNIEKSLAIRNIRLQRKNLSGTIMPLSLTMILFIVLYCNYTMKVEKYNEHENNLLNIQYVVNDETIKEEEIMYMKGIEEIDSIYRSRYSEGYVFIKAMTMKDEFVNGSISSNVLQYNGYTGLKAKIIDGDSYFINICNEKLDLHYEQIDNINSGEVVVIDTNFMRKNVVIDQIINNGILVPNEKKLAIYGVNERLSREKSILNEDNFKLLKVKCRLDKEQLMNEFLEPEYHVKVILNHEDYNKFMGSLGYDSVFIKVKANNVEKVVDKISYMKKGAAKNIYNMKNKREEAIKNIKIEIAYQYGAGIVIAIISLLNIMNSAITDIISRKKELLLYKAIGMSNRQITKTVLWEATIISIISCIIGILIGGGVTAVYPIRLLLEGKFYIVGWVLTLVGFSVAVIILTIVGILISLKGFLTKS